MTGSYHFEVSFCNSVKIRSVDTGFGWDYGEFELFYPGDPNYVPPLNESNLVGFQQQYGFGDNGPPCPESINRQSRVDLMCDSKATCSGLPGATGPECLNGNPDEDFCICGVIWQTVLDQNPLCAGLQISLMSHVCVPGQITPVPSPPETPGGVAGTVFLVLFLLVIVVFLVGAVYNFFVLGARGMAVLPLYATCCGVQTARPQYTQEYPASNTGTGYGSL